MCKKLVFVHSEDDRKLLVWWVNWITCRKSPCITPWIVCRKSPCVTLNYVPKISIYNSVNCVPKISAYHFVNYVQGISTYHPVNYMPEISICHCLLSFSYVQQIFMYYPWIGCRKSPCVSLGELCSGNLRVSLYEFYARNLRVSLRELCAGNLHVSLRESCAGNLHISYHFVKFLQEICVYHFVNWDIYGSLYMKHPYFFLLGYWPGKV